MKLLILTIVAVVFLGSCTEDIDAPTTPAGLASAVWNSFNWDQGNWQ